jgi:hypothetical protein
LQEELPQEMQTQFMDALDREVPGYSSTHPRRQKALLETKLLGNTVTRVSQLVEEWIAPSATDIQFENTTRVWFECKERGANRRS